MLQNKNGTNNTWRNIFISVEVNVVFNFGLEIFPQRGLIIEC